MHYLEDVYVDTVIVENSICSAVTELSYCLSKIFFSGQTTVLYDTVYKGATTVLPYFSEFWVNNLDWKGPWSQDCVIYILAKYYYPGSTVK